MSNYFYDLPKELQCEICQYIPYKRHCLQSYILDIQEIAMDWFNKVYNETNYMEVKFRNFQERGGLNSEQANRFKYGVFQYCREKRFFYLVFCHSSGHFKKIAKRRNLRNLEKNLK